VVARVFRDDADVAAFLREFGDFLFSEWSKYAWLKIPTTARRQYLRGLGYTYVHMDLKRLPERAFRKYRYESPRGYTALLGVWELGAYLGIYVGGRELLGVPFLPTGYGLSEAVVKLYRAGLGVEPLEGLARYAASVGVPEVARAMEAIAELYRASEPLVARELASGPGEPPDWFKQDLVSEALLLVQRIAYQLARGYYRDWSQVEKPLRCISMAEECSIDIIEAVQHFEDREKLARDLARAVENYQNVMAKKAVLKAALAMGLLEPPGA